MCVHFDDCARPVNVSCLRKNTYYKQTNNYVYNHVRSLSKKILQVEFYIMFVKLIGNSIASRWCATSAILFELKTGSRILSFKTSYLIF